MPSGDDWLSAPEKARLANFRIPKRRNDWLLGRWTAKCAVVKRLPRPWPAFSEIEIRPASTGAPEVFCSGQQLPYTISLSHRGGRAACFIAHAGVAIGCDLELVEPRSEEFVRDYFTVEEQAAIAEASPGDRFALIAILWSLKESVLKATQEGLRCDTRTVAVSPLPFLRAKCSDRSEVASVKGFPAHMRHTESGREFRGSWRREDDLIRTFAVESRHLATE